KFPFDLIEEIEKELKLPLHPMTWPINMGKEFKGVYNLHDKNLILFSPNQKITEENSVHIQSLDDELLDQKVGQRDAGQLREDVELLDGVYGSLNVQDYLDGKVAPLFFGSAVNNFGIKEMLDTFVEIAPVPRGRNTSSGEVQPEDKNFSGFVFKIH